MTLSLFNTPFSTEFTIITALSLFLFAFYRRFADIGRNHIGNHARKDTLNCPDSPCTFLQVTPCGAYGAVNINPLTSTGSNITMAQEKNNSPHHCDRMTCAKCCLGKVTQFVAPTTLTLVDHIANVTLWLVARLSIRRSALIPIFLGEPGHPASLQYQQWLCFFELVHTPRGKLLFAAYRIKEGTMIGYRYNHSGILYVLRLITHYAFSVKARFQEKQKD